MIIDTTAYFILIIHDVPSFVLDRDFSIIVIHCSAILIQCLQWFVQLLFLPLLAIIHFLAIFCPLRFRKLSRTHFWMADFGVLLLGLLLTVPFFTKYFGYVYLVDGHYWYFDFNKPYTYLYNSINRILQIFCVTFVVIIDSLIIWKVFSLRSSTQKMAVGVNGNGAKQRNLHRRKVSKETLFAVYFLMLSACFLLKTLCYNIDMGYFENLAITLIEHIGNGTWQQLAVKLTSNINLSKWALYALGNPVISQAIVSAKNAEHTPVTTVAKLVAKP